MKEYYCNQCFKDIEPDFTFEFPYLCHGCRWHGHRNKRSIRARMLLSAQNRAEKAEVPFAITEDDIVIPKYCPILGLKLIAGRDTFQDASASLDRIIPSLGYVKGNIAVISWKANRIKNNGTAEEHAKIADWIKANAPKI